jgi:hypothetical protein
MAIKSMNIQGPFSRPISDKTLQHNGGPESYHCDNDFVMERYINHNLRWTNVKKVFGVCPSTGSVNYQSNSSLTYCLLFLNLRVSFAALHGPSPESHSVLNSGALV